MGGLPTACHPLGRLCSCKGARGRGLRSEAPSLRHTPLDWLSSAESFKRGQPVGVLSRTRGLLESPRGGRPNSAWVEVIPYLAKLPAHRHQRQRGLGKQRNEEHPRDGGNPTLGSPPSLGFEFDSSFQPPPPDDPDHRENARRDPLGEDSPGPRADSPRRKTVASREGARSGTTPELACRQSDDARARRFCRVGLRPRDLG
jgi:hypothetical protein